MSAPLHPSLDPALFGEPSARDARFTVVDVWADCANLPLDDPRKKQEFLHRQMNEEACVMENAARSLAEFTEEDWSIRMWLARQCHDEARHVMNYRKLFVERGGQVGEFPVLGFQYRVLGKVDTLIGRLGVQNRTFEADGLDAVTHAIEEAREEGDLALAAMYEAQQADEVLHIRFANEWIRQRVTESPREAIRMGSALHKAAKAFTQTFANGGTNVSKYGVAEEPRQEAGFVPEEVEVAVRMSDVRRAAVRGSGS
ncbi:MAG: DUF455 family protein [Gemmatimonadota bacterium]